MRLEFHRLISSDISTIMTYYEDVGGPKLAEEFYSELRQSFQKAAINPEAYGIRELDLRRVNLETFPYHFLFRIVDDRVRVLVVRASGDGYHHRFAVGFAYDRAPTRAVVEVSSNLSWKLPSLR